MTAAVVDLDQYEGTKVKLTYKEDGETKSVSGSVEAANEVMILVKYKGKGIMVEAGDILEIAASDESLKQTDLKPVNIKTVKRHLVNAHGYLLSQVNQISEEEAVTHHDNAHDKLGEDIGHRHVEKKAKSEKESKSDDSDK